MGSAGGHRSPKRIAAPKLAQPRIAAAAESIEFVFDRVLLVEVLVVLLGRVKGRSLCDLGLNRLVETVRFLERFLRGLRRLQLQIGVDENRRAVLVTAIAELSS